MTEQELMDLPVVEDLVLWQDDDGPTTVTDSQGRSWFIGICMALETFAAQYFGQGTHEGRLCKRKAT